MRAENILRPLPLEVLEMKKINTIVSQKDLALFKNCATDAEFQKVAAQIRKKYKLPSDLKYSISCFDGSVYVGEKLKLTNV